MERPRIDTERLDLRPFLPEDAPEVQRLLSDPDVTATTLTLPYPYGEGEAERWIGTHQEDFEIGRRITFALERRRDRALVGSISLQLVPDHDRAELGYWIGKEYWNRGYATEAARAVLAFGFNTLGLNRIQARFFTRNPASRRVLEKLGMHPEGVLSQYVRRWGRYEDVAIHALLRSGFERSD